MNNDKVMIVKVPGELKDKINKTARHLMISESGLVRMACAQYIDGVLR